MNDFKRGVGITDWEGISGDDDLRLIGELLSLTYDDFNQKAECSLTLKRSAATDKGLKHLKGMIHGS